MASTYKTPGVYVEEIAKFPPSVASVETAIPAFIGYTEFAEKNGESLKNIPTSIDSFLEFEQYFGGPPPRNIIVRLNTANQYVRTERQGTTYLLYDSVRLFYDNGGGVCYIVSVDGYTKPPAIGNDTSGILGGLKALEKYDEPTLIVSPDSVSLGANLYQFQQQAINQCNKLQDRFVICDLLKSDETVPGESFFDRVDDFRNNIGINFLKYAAAYTPWLRASLPPGLRFRDIIFALEGDPAPDAVSSLALLSSLTTAPNLLQLLFDLDNAIEAVDLINLRMKPGAAGSLVDSGIADLEAQLKFLHGKYMTAYNTQTTFPLLTPPVAAIFSRIRDILHTIREISLSLPNVVLALLIPSDTATVEFKLKTDIEKLLETYKGLVSSLVTHQLEYVAKSGIDVLAAADLKVVDILTFSTFGTFPNVTPDRAVQALYRTYALKKPTMLFLNSIAAAAANAPAAAAAVATVIPAPADLKANLELMILVQITAGPFAPTDTAAALETVVNAAIGTIDDTADLLLTIIDNYLLDAIDVKATVTIDEVFPGAEFSSAVAKSMNQFLLEAKNLAALAAAPPGATVLNVTAALVFTASDPKEYSLIASTAAQVAGPAAINFYTSILNSAEAYESTFDQSLLDSFGLYKTLVTRAGRDLMILPPGAAVAGVYASVDSNRGVWKAPANASLASVLGPHFLINAQEQESLNIDTNAGKSINAIRAFTGKGTLVWGTRTLAGNDNEWKFVPVRRFFTYAEESIKKATEPFVFEPNDRNTWVRVKAMIENFLTLEWRRGALAGAKPGDAFYVKVGLGETMTALDILDGKMIIEVGMAVVRPAEFIILRFAHKMQES